MHGGPRRGRGEAPGFRAELVESEAQEALEGERSLRAALELVAIEEAIATAEATTAAAVGDTGGVDAARAALVRELVADAQAVLDREEDVLLQDASPTEAALIRCAARSDLQGAIKRLEEDVAECQLSCDRSNVEEDHEALETDRKFEQSLHDVRQRLREAVAVLDEQLSPSPSEEVAVDGAAADAQTDAPAPTANDAQPVEPVLMEPCTHEYTKQRSTACPEFERVAESVDPAPRL